MDRVSQRRPYLVGRAAEDLRRKYAERRITFDEFERRMKELKKDG